MISNRRTRLQFVVFLLLTSITVTAKSQDSDAQQVQSDAAGLHGGLIVQLGASDTGDATALSLTGRYLIHVLDPNTGVVAAARAKLRAGGHYGLAWVEHHQPVNRLPYAENVVNLIIIRDYGVPVAELTRVLTPGGAVVIANPGNDSIKDLRDAGFLMETAGQRVVARKPWPSAMDTWSHSRHGADGNAVSGDTLVGPPERVRWVAAATSEVEGMVTAGGRNYYGGILARDSFNGLRLWHRELNRKGVLNSPDFNLPRLPRDGARPAASSDLVFAVVQNRPVALDAKTGEIIVEFGDLTNPGTMLHDGRRVIAADTESVRAFNTKTGEQIWKVDAPGARNVIADGQIVAFIQGRVRRGEKSEAVVVEAANGKLLWKRKDYDWLDQVSRTVLAKSRLVFEVSTFNDHDAGNAIHVVESNTGEHCWSKHYAPGMNHARQARAMFLEDDLWILHGGKINTDAKEKLKREQVQVSALDPLTGDVRKTFPAGLAHCFPPVATPNFMFAGELDLTNLKSGEIIANRITKANCSRENGWVPANGLIYTTPKHCTCWPMLRGFVAMAPAKPDVRASIPLDQLTFTPVPGPAQYDPAAPVAKPDDWPQYRQNQWRSASTQGPGPKQPQIQWRIELAKSAPQAEGGPIINDWRDNPVIKGPISAPTVANGIAYVARPDAHELVAIDTKQGNVLWRHTTNGRLDTPPTIHRGLCLFGVASGWVYAVRADTGDVVWKLRAAPSDERIVAYGQVESPWPVPGTVLVMDDVAYFAAGRQPLADGGILVFAVDPMTGQQHWVQRIDSVPQKGFYENSGLEFDPFDILHAEGDGLAMSRWVLSRDGQQVSVDKWNAFAKLNTGEGEVWIPRGSWTYGARHQHRFRGEAPRRPLITFRDDKFFSSLNGRTDLFCRDFNLEDGEKFDSKWITGWKAGQLARENGKPYRTYRIAEGAKWAIDPFAKAGEKAPDPKAGTQLHNRVHALALAGNNRLYVVHQDGRLRVLSSESGQLIGEAQVPRPAWDGLAIAEGRLFLSTQDGELLCLGDVTKE